MNLRNDLDYPYSNIFLFLKTTFPGGQFAMDTIECQLADPDGKWTGSGMGRVRFNRFLFQKGVQVQAGGTYVFDFEQAMRVNDAERDHRISGYGLKRNNDQLNTAKNARRNNKQDS